MNLKSIICASLFSYVSHAQFVQSPDLSSNLTTAISQTNLFELNFFMPKKAKKNYWYLNIIGDPEEFYKELQQKLIYTHHRWRYEFDGKRVKIAYKLSNQYRKNQLNPPLVE